MEKANARTRMSPLAKADRARPGLCERFEVFTCTKEIANAVCILKPSVPSPFPPREEYFGRLYSVMKQLTFDFS